MVHKSNALKRDLSLFSLCVFGIGIIVGAGIYSVIGVAYGHAGGSLWLSFLIAGLAAVLTGVSYCELSTMYPATGAEFIFLRHAFPGKNYFAFVTAILLILGGAATAAAVSVSFNGYLQFFFHTHFFVVPVLLILLCTLVNSLGIESSNRANLIFTALEILGILLVVYAGLNSDTTATPVTFEFNEKSMKAVNLIFFVYLGFEGITNLTEETRSPEKNIPRAILLSLLITTMLYIAVTFAVIKLATPAEMAGSHYPLSDVLQKTHPKLSHFVSGIALFSTANTVLVALLVYSRMLFSVARSGYLPEILSVIHPKKKTPVMASVALMILAMILLKAGSLELLVNVSSLSTLLAFSAVNLSVIRLRYLEKDKQRRFKAPLNIGRFPLLPAAGALLTLYMTTEFEKNVYFVTVALVIVSLLYFFVRRK